MPESPPANDKTGDGDATKPLELRLSLLRGRIAAEVVAMGALVTIAGICIENDFDDLHQKTAASARERMIAWGTLVKRLEQERADARLAGEAAIEFRAERAGRRR